MMPRSKDQLVTPHTCVCAALLHFSGTESLPHALKGQLQEILTEMLFTLASAVRTLAYTENCLEAPRFA